MIDPLLRLLLVRHSEAEGNYPNTFLGRIDAPLNGRGQQQASGLAQALSTEPIAAIYTSPLTRARATASLVALPHGLVPRVDQRLCEQSFGLWEGLTFAQAAEQYPEDYAAWQADAASSAPTQGESLAQVAARHLSFYSDLRARHPHQTVVLVGHGGGLNALLCGLLDTPLHWLWSYRLALGSVSEVVAYAERSVLTRLSH